MTFVLASCSRHEHSGAEADPGHHFPTGEEERETRSVTLYSEKIEVFTEYQILQQDIPSEFLIHATRIDSGHRALSGGEVKVELATAGHTQLSEADPAATEGIYKLRFTPEKSGEAELKFHVATGGKTETLAAGSVRVLAAEEQPVPSEEMNAGLLRFTKEQAWQGHFNVIRVREDSFSRVIAASGEFLALPGEKQHVTAKTEGTVLYGKQGLVQGRYVSENEELFTITDRGLVDNNVTVRYNRARVNFEKSKRDYARHIALFDENIISEKQFLETEGQYLNDSIEYYAYKKSMSSNGMVISSPKSGYVHELQVAEGQYVKPGDLMATISSNKVMLLRVDVPQQHFDLLGKITTARFRPAYSSRVYSIGELSGKLLATGASVAENNHYIPVYFEVVNDGTLLEGAYAEFYLKGDPEPGHLVVPETALLEEQGNYYVYVQVSGEAYQKRPVILRSFDGKYASVASGIEHGDRIVSEGVMLVKTATSTALPSHGHSH